MGSALAVCGGVLPLPQYRTAERGHRELGSAPVRATAISLNLFCIHFFGDTFSPQIIGAISDRSNLSIGLGATLVFLVISSTILFSGARLAPVLKD